MIKRWYFVNPLILQKFIWVPTRLSLIFFCRFKVKGLENIKEVKQHVIFACNHLGELDPILLPAALPFWSRFSPMFYVSREKNFYGDSGWRRNFYGGWFFRIWGAYPVYIGLRNYKKALANHIKIVQDGGSLCIFPEGASTPNGEILPAKGGVAYLAYATKTPVVPVKITGAFHLTLKEFLFRRRELVIEFGKPIYFITENLNTIQLEEFKTKANHIMNIIGNMV